MMKKLRSKAGMTLFEMLVSLLITVLLVIGMGVGMNTGSRVYQEATFESDSATLAGILNTNLGDVLRYSRNIVENNGVSFVDENNNVITKDDVGFFFTNLEYGVQKGYISLNDETGVLELENLKNNVVVELVNAGAYPDMKVSDFSLSFTAETGRSGYFTVSYKIISTENVTLTREVKSVIRVMN